MLFIVFFLMLFLFITEGIGRYNFWHFVYEIGIPFNTMYLSFNIEYFNIKKGRIFEKKEGRFYFKDRKTVYVTSNLTGFEPFTFQTPIKSRCVGSIIDGRVKMKIKQPLLGTVFLVFLLFLGIICSVFLYLFPESRIYSLILFGCSIIVFLLFMFSFFRTKRLKLIINELEIIIKSITNFKIWKRRK